jgi:hypothetical protein
MAARVEKALVAVPADPMFAGEVSSVAIDLARILGSAGNG